MLKVKIINTSGNPNPQYKTAGAAGMDIFAGQSLILHAGKVQKVSTGIYMKIPDGYECQIRGRSGLALNQGITAYNSPATIDSDYTGEIGVVLENHSNRDHYINKGDRIAQLVFNKVEKVEFEEVTILDTTERGENGFGSTGLKD